MAACRRLCLKLVHIGPSLSLRVGSVSALDGMRFSMLTFRLFGGGMNEREIGHFDNLRIFGIFAEVFAE